MQNEINIKEGCKKTDRYKSVYNGFAFSIDKLQWFHYCYLLIPH
jgi:hypothetical protein